MITSAFAWNAKVSLHQKVTLWEIQGTRWDYKNGIPVATFLRWDIRASTKVFTSVIYNRGYW